jgi:hypothetical protein
MKLRNKKTGEVVDFKIVADYDDCTSGWRLEKQDGSVLFYDHIDEIHEELEDYKPKEPLIKDEKIRKAVRAWAEAHGETEFDVKGACLVTTFKGLHSLLEVDFRCSWTRNGVYTIDELCGEEEAPEPIEPTFVDLDERVREKEKECES